MEASSFWLLSIEESFVNVSLLSNVDGKYIISSVGPQKSWDSNDPDSLVASTDESLSAAAVDSGLSEEAEPSQAAFVLPPFWVGSDGKIVSSKLKLIENLCRSLSIKPIGFIANDEAIVEESNQADGFPASFILLSLGVQEFTLSLVYLGHVKERIKRAFEGQFNPQFVESALLELKSESALPPQIIVFGQVDVSTLSHIKNFAWVGKKDVETFLHFPDVTLYDINTLANVYSKIIVSQINPSSLVSSLDKKEQVAVIDDEPETEEEVETQEEETPSHVELNHDIPQEELEPEQEMVEVSPVDLGFVNITPEPELNYVTPPAFTQTSLDLEPENINPINATVAPEIQTLKPKAKIKFPKLSLNLSILSKIKLPKFKLKVGKFGFIALSVSPLLILIPFYFSKASIILFVTPYSFNKQIPAALDSSITEINVSRAQIPVTKKVLAVNTQASVPTTGKKVVGDKAKGQIVVFNKLDKSQTLPKGTVLVDPNGRQYLLDSAVSVASSSSNLELGVINLGQTKTMVTAGDIGPEFNINKDTKLKFKDVAETSLIAKVENNFTGGSKQDINAVSEQDKTALNQKLKQAIADSVTSQINTELSSMPGIIKETIQTKQEQVDFSREVGEQADELSATAQADVSVFIMDPNIKEQIINGFLASEQGFSQADINPQTFNIGIRVDKIDTDRANGVLTISGQALPKIDVIGLKKILSGKSKNKAGILIKKNVQRAYNFNIKTNLEFLKFLNPLPFRSENITIDVRSESL